MNNHLQTYNTLKLLALFIFSFMSYAVVADNTAIYRYIASQRTGVILSDNVEHGQCGFGLFAPWNSKANNGNGAGSTCKNPDPNAPAWPGLIDIISTPNAPNGNKVYRMPALPSPDWNGIDEVGIHTAKFSSAHPVLLAAQKLNDQGTAIVSYSAYYYLESGFDDFSDAVGGPWHLQMQWKNRGKNYGGENPKIAWGFSNNPDSNNDYTRQVQLNMRDPEVGDCNKTIKTYTRKDIGDGTLAVIPVPLKTWVRITIEVKFNATTGYVRIWQSSINNPVDLLVVDVNNINTLSQIIKKCENANCTDVDLSAHLSCVDSNGNKQYWTNFNNFSFGVINYMNTISYKPGNRGGNENFVIYVDDIKIRKP